MKKILFITATRIGDAVLSTGILNALCKQYPQAAITVACGPLVAELFAACPQVHRVIPLKKQPYAGHWRFLWGQVVPTRWDTVIDLRNSIISRLVLSGHTYVFGPSIPTHLHKVEQYAHLMGLTPPPAPHLWVDAQTAAQAEALMAGDGPILAVGPTANWAAKTWPSDRFITVIQKLTGVGGQMQGARVAVLAAESERVQAAPVLAALPPDRIINLVGVGGPLLAAACLKHARLFVGHDSGLSHMAAAMGTPTLALFGPSWPHIYKPWGQHAAFVSTPENFDTLIDYAGYDPKTAQCLMTTLETATVTAAAQALFARTA